MEKKQKRRSRWTKRLSSKIAILVGPLLIRLLAKTWRVRYVHPEELEDAYTEEAGPVGSFWHRNILPAIGSHRGMALRVVVSLHRDGEMIASIAERLGYRTIRGSSSKGGAQAVRSMVGDDHGRDALCFTPDGPRGPIYSVAPGVAFIAARLRRTVVTSGFAISRYWEANSWDRMVIPKPFARIVVVYSSKLGIPPPPVSEEGEAQREYLGRIRESMDACEALAQEQLKEWLAE